MIRIQGVIAVVILAGTASVTCAGPIKPPDPATTLAALGDGSVGALSGSLRKLILQFLPTPLYVDEKHWGQQKEVKEFVWRGKGLDADLDPVLVKKNHGVWWKVKVTSPSIADTLVFNLRDMQTPEPGRMVFTSLVSFDVDVEYERQRWNEGLRLSSTSVCARMRVMMNLQCEALSRVEKKGLLPEVVFRLHIVKANCDFDNFVVEHVAGVGGEAARLIGETARRSLKQWHPSFEKHLKEKADAAIVKAGDTKEVRLSLGKLLGGQK